MKHLNPEGVKALAELLIESALDDTVKRGLEAARRINSQMTTRGSGGRRRIASSTENVVYYGRTTASTEG